MKEPVAGPEAGKRGLSFDKEKIRTHPAIAVPISDTTCRLTIFEGKHHQIKRMFLRFGIRVTRLHRESIGPYHLPPDLPPGRYQPFVPESPK